MASASDDHEPEPEADHEPEGASPAGHGLATNPTSAEPGPAAASARTKATDRAARRAGSGTAGPPPAHQDTWAPANSAWATADTADPDQAPGADTSRAGQGGDTGPKAANTDRTDPAPAATAAERAS